MEAGLAEREAVYRQLNRELEERSRSLLDNIELAAESEDIFAAYPRNRRRRKSEKVGKEEKDSTRKEEPVVEGRARETACCCGEEKDNTWQFLQQFVRVSVEQGILPHSFLKERVSGESVCRLMSSELQLLRRQLEDMQKLINEKTASCERHLSAQAESDTERARLARRVCQLKSQADRLPALQARLAETITEAKESNRRASESATQRDRSEAELRKLRGSSNAKITPLEDALASARAELAAAAAENKELRASIRASASTNSERERTLANERRGLHQTVRKLSELVDNLRQQRELLRHKIDLNGVVCEYDALIRGKKS